MAWDILFYIALVTIIALVVLLYFYKFGKNVYLSNFEQDELFEETDDVDVKSYVFSTNGETRKYIRRYAVRKTKYDNFVICNYNKNFKTISYYVACLNSKNKPISILQVTEKNTNTNSSKIIVVPAKTKYVNVIIKEADGQIINDRIIQPLSERHVLYFSLITTGLVFCSLFVLRHLAALITVGYLRKYYFNHIYNYIALLICFGISLIYFIITFLAMKKRNFKNRNGGKAGYEFFK